MNKATSDLAAIDEMHAVVDSHVRSHRYATILDVGAWFIPYPPATHVIDLMPWETRGGRLRLQREPGESFSRETWSQLDLCSSSLLFPFADKSFDFVMCSGTIEDLPDPLPCIREMQRVAHAGYIRVPSMACEVTIGVNGRATQEIGYSHHHWICRSHDRRMLVMMAKRDACLSARYGRCIPLLGLERLARARSSDFDYNIHFFWDGTFQVDVLTGPQVDIAIATYLSSLGITRTEHGKDAILRRLRRIRDRLKNRLEPVDAATKWWREMLQISRPYMRTETPS